MATPTGDTALWEFNDAEGDDQQVQFRRNGSLARQPRGLARSQSERHRKAISADPDTVVVAMFDPSHLKPSTAMSSLSVNEVSSLPTSPQGSPSGSPSQPPRRRAFSFKRAPKPKPKVAELDAAFSRSTLGAPDVSDNESGSTSPTPDHKKGGIKRFLMMSWRGKKKKSESSHDNGSESADANSLMRPSTAPAKADYFKSKKGKHLWVSRYGQEETNLGSIYIGDLVLEEANAIQIYAIHTLTDLLPRPIMHDPFSPRTHAVDLMHRRSTFGERFKNAFRTRSSTSSSTNTLRPTSSGSDLSSSFGHTLEEVLIEDRMRTGDVHLRIPLVVSMCVEYLRTFGVSTAGIFRVPGSAKRIRLLLEAFDAGLPPDFSQAQPADVASVLKHFLRELPEPLLIAPLYQNFIDIPRLESADSKLLALRLLIMLLPSINREILAVVLDLLALIAASADAPDGSKMNSHNLSLVFSPNLLRDTRPDPKADPRAARLDPKKRTTSRERLSGFLEDSLEASILNAEEDASEVVEMMIDYNEHLFTIPPELRDQVLLFHSTQNPQIVSDVVRKIIERATGSFCRSSTAPASMGSLASLNGASPSGHASGSPSSAFQSPAPEASYVAPMRQPPYRHESMRFKQVLPIVSVVRQASNTSLTPPHSPLRLELSLSAPRIASRRASEDDTPLTPMSPAHRRHLDVSGSPDSNISAPSPRETASSPRDAAPATPVRLLQAMQRRRLSLQDNSRSSFNSESGLFSFQMDDDGSGTLV